jgi:hypothetical protein
MAVKIPNSKCPIPVFSIPRPSKIYQNWDSLYENVLSGSPEMNNKLKLRQKKKKSYFLSSGLGAEKGRIILKLRWAIAFRF